MTSIRELLVVVSSVGLFILGLFLLILAVHTVVRIVRHFYKFPIPHFLANLIDNPLRRRIQPLAEMPIRHGIVAGMTVLEVGPGNGTYTMATAKMIGEAGKVYTIDIEPRMIERVKQRAEAEGHNNVEAQVADVFELPFDDDYFDVIYMIAVIGEIPTPQRALQEFFRVLKPSGGLAFSEILTDPDYYRMPTLKHMSSGVGFRERKKLGNWFSYTLIMEKPEAQAV